MCADYLARRRARARWLQDRTTFGEPNHFITGEVDEGLPDTSHTLDDLCLGPVPTSSQEATVVRVFEQLLSHGTSHDVDSYDAQNSLIHLLSSNSISMSIAYKVGQAVSLRKGLSIEALECSMAWPSAPYVVCSSVENCRFSKDRELSG